MSYNKDIDYEAKINEAVKSGNYEKAAEYEKSRNEKIDAEGLNYEKTNRYSGWLDKTDYSNVIKKQISSRAPKSVVSDSLKKRVAKASGTEGLSQYAYDDVYDKAVKYIMGADSFSHEGNKPAFKSKYDKEIEKLLKDLRSVKNFSYDPQKDELYNYYKEQYNREGKRAMEDVLGAVSANTGGMPSSYAVTAAAQSREEYNKKLTDKIPELYNRALESYIKEIGIDTDTLEFMKKLSDEEYSRYKDSINQYNEDREFDYKVFLDEKKNAREEEKAEREYAADIEKIKNTSEENAAKQAENERKSIRDEEKEKIKNALEKWDRLGYLDEESAEILGIPAGTHSVDYDYKTAQQYKMYKK